MGKRRPWNIIDCPVYSLATYQDGKVNMNICTYVSAVSLHPKLYAIAVYEGTQSLENVENTNYVVLQILRKKHLHLVEQLGKKSGKHINKHQLLEQQEALMDWRGLKVIKDAAAYLLLEKQTSQITGDHTLYIFSVKHSSTQHEHDLLMFQDLIDQKIIL